MASREELRRLAQQQNLKAYQQSKEAQEEASGGVIRLGGRDPQTGKDVIIHQNDSQEIAGVRTFNASLAHGALVRATRPHGSSIVAVDSRSTFIEEEVEEVVEIKKKKQIIYPFKILFSVVEDGVRKFYVGGDRVTPILIYSLNNVNFDYKAFIDSTGISLTKFVAGIYCNTPEVGVAIVSETGVDFVSTLTSKFGNFISREGHWKSYGVIYSNLIKPSFNLRKTSEVVTGDEIFFSLATDEVRRGNAYPFYDPLFPPKTQQRTQGLLRVDSSGTLPSSHTGNYSYVKNITQGNNGRASFATETLNVIESFSGIPQSYFSVNGSKTIFNGQYSYEKANTENHEYREVSAHLPWDATTTSNYQTNFNSNFTGQIAVSEGVYKDILDTETRTSIKNVSTKQYSPYGGRYYSSYDRVLESNETQNKEQKYYGLQYISNQKNLSVFSE